MAIHSNADVSPPRPTSLRGYWKAMPWLRDETPFPCECCGDLVTLEKAKLKDDVRGLNKAWNGWRKLFKR